MSQELSSRVNGTPTRRPTATSARPDVRRKRRRIRLEGKEKFAVRRVGRDCHQFGPGIRQPLEPIFGVMRVHVTPLPRTAFVRSLWTVAGRETLLPRPYAFNGSEDVT